MFTGNITRCYSIKGISSFFIIFMIRKLFQFNGKNSFSLIDLDKKATLAIQNHFRLSNYQMLVLSWIKGTDLRNNSFGIDGKKQEGVTRKHTKEAIPLTQCVETIISAIEKDLKTIYIPKKLSLIPFLKVFFNRFLEKKVINAINANKKQ